MPQTIFLFLATGSLQQLGFKPSLPQRPIPDLERGSKDLGSSRPVETPAKSKEGEARGLKGRVRQDMPPLPWIDPFPAVPPTDHPSEAAVRRAELPQWGLRWGHKGVTRGFQEKGGKGRGGMWTPSPPWGARGRWPPGPRRLRLRSCPDPSQVPDLLLLSPSRLLCAGVRHSDPPSPHEGNSSCRSATGSTSPFGKENFPCPPQGLAPRPALCTPGPPPPPPPTQRPLQPPKPGNSRHQQSKCACAGDVALRGGSKGEGKGVK